MKHLFLFTISPVQSFISQARKTQDLYAGSLILSDLMKSVINKLKNSEIIFPQLPEQDISATHRILFLSENPNIVKELSDFVKKEFEKISKKALDNVLKKTDKDFNDLAKRQIDDFLKTYWAAIEYNEDKDFVTQYSEVERLLAAVKNARLFTPLEEQGRKCSLCGERNVKIFKANYKKDNKGNEIKTIPAFIEAEAVEIEKKNNKLEQGEGLCAVCATKRFYETKTFPSTARVALLDMLDKISENNDILDAFCNFIKYFKISSQEKWLFEIITNCNGLNINFNNAVEFNDQYFYQENILKESFKDVQTFKDIKSAQRELSKKLKDKKIPLTKYYAIIQFDGDNMGSLMAGDFFDEENKSKYDLKIFQKEVSVLLGKYAKWAKQYLIEQKKGEAIYAGGDDFLGFVNLHHLFKVMKELRFQFDVLVNQEIKKKYPLNRDFTFSAGVVIAHYKIPLNIVMNWTHIMEKKAKNNEGKNSFAIAVLKHSGETIQMLSEWGKQGDNSSPIGNIKEKIENNYFSSAFINNFIQEFQVIIDRDGKAKKVSDIRALTETELRRLIYRSANKEWNKDKKLKETEEMVNDIMVFFDKKDLNNFISFLNICDFMVRKTNK